MPKNNLPPESQMWARDLEARLSRLETSSNNLGTLIASSNNRVNSLSATNERLLSQTESLSETNERLLSQTESLLATNEYLLHQTEVAEQRPGVVVGVLRSPATANEDTTWVVSDPAAEASVTLTTSSTGRVLVLTGAALWAYGANGAVCRTFTGVEVRYADTGTLAQGAYFGSGPMISSENGQSSAFVAGQPKVWSLQPFTKYIFRVRRGFQVNIDNATETPVTQSSWQGTTISVTKLGL